MYEHNKVELIGRMGQDPKVIECKNGSTMVAFSLATNKWWLDKQTKEMQSKTTWHNIVAFGYAASDVQKKNMVKGSYIYVEGSIDYKQSERDGMLTMSTSIIASKVGLLEKKQMDKQQSFDALHAKATAAKKADAVDPNFDDNLDVVWPE